MQPGSSIPARVYSFKPSPSVVAFEKQCTQTTTNDNYPLASKIESNIPVYDLSKLDAADQTLHEPLRSEWHHSLLSGPGIVVLKNMYQDKELLQQTNSVYQRIIESEKTNSKGDHFGGKGANDRVWNSFSKHCLAEPSTFVEYYSNAWLALICDAWLGPAYRITAQVNIVRPGGAAQICHRDYHLGFQTAENCQRFPVVIQIASQLLTLQGAVAHSDMPVESGPTRLLPFSQLFKEGYMAYRLPEFNDYFLHNYVTLPLSLGDGLFFNPALFHAAGENFTTDISRSANLLQISSAFAKPMEAIDSISLVERCWNDLQQKFEHEGASERTHAFIAAIAEGYPFPTNLDRRPPLPGGMAPESEQDILWKALKDHWDVEKVIKELHAMKQGSEA
jgi:ectoine hydroxylase-related dioxygenase (phytanoyl-CoA dioxygenase family)